MQNDLVTKERNFDDANLLGKMIPKELLMQYQGKWYILKAGLEWKANLLYRGGNYGVTTEIVERTQDYVLAKATFKTKDGVEFSNYGEASKLNVTNPQMHKYLLHLAVTRAECRVLRMATACGYTSVDEMDMGGEKELPVGDHDNEKPTDAQVQALEAMGVKEKPKDQKEAKELIAKNVSKT